MTERERTIIRVAGLVVHAVGFLVLLVSVVLGSGPLTVVGVLSFIVGGAWGWGMVLAAARAAERDRLADQAQTARRRSFSSTFDDEPEPAPRTITPPPPIVPPGRVGGP